MTSDAFVGDWRVTEYVFDPEGTYQGRIRQQRHLERRTDGRIRVTQVCEPERRLIDHPMAEFAGTWDFDLTIDGDRRLYQGPDVIGSATEWEPGAMTGRGVWPRFGHDFDSFSVMVAEGRQITGGRFGVTVDPVAVIIGVAEPAASMGDDQWPGLDLDWWPNETVIRPEGEGRQLRYGPSLRGTWWDRPGHRTELLVVADHASSAVVGFTTGMDRQGRTVTPVRIEVPTA